MRKIQCFKIKRGTDYDKEVKQHFELLSKWEGIFEEVGELLGEKITKMVFDTDNLIILLSEIKNEDTKKLFTKSGHLKRNLKAANNLRKEYHKIIAEKGLKEYEELTFINFRHGVMRFAGSEMKSFRTSENDIYYKADFDLERKSGGMVEPITEIEYEEKYLEELKKRDVS